MESPLKDRKSICPECFSSDASQVSSSNLNRGIFFRVQELYTCSLNHDFRSQHITVEHLDLVGFKFTENSPRGLLDLIRSHSTCHSQAEASAAWAHRRRQELPMAVARACAVPGAELWVA